ncbi:MAG TPA: winged helix DNA-binding domain-containing protein [Bacillota bacterium]
MKPIILTQLQARQFILAYQGLQPSLELTGKSGVLEYIRRVGCIQYDPLDIVGHNPELVLQARVAGFHPAMLQELLYSDRKLLDGWDKMMAVYPVEDWPYFRRQREAAREYFGNSSRPVVAVLPQVRQAIEAQGPLSSIDLQLNEIVDWPWAPTRLSRAALESMYFWGELVIHHKVHTRKVYDFARRHLPAELLEAADPNITAEQYQDWRVLRRIGGIGLVWAKSGDAWLGTEIKSKERAASLARLLKTGKIIEVRITDLETPFYMRSADRLYLERVLNSGDPAPHAAILAPLDNLLWDRRLIKTLFDFDYRWEVYKPVTERQYGYYVLPVLYGDGFVARFEPGRDKKGKALMIKNWWWEPGVKRRQKMDRALGQCFQNFLNYLGAERIQMDKKVLAQADLEFLISKN